MCLYYVASKNITLKITIYCHMFREIILVFIDNKQLKHADLTCVHNMWICVRIWQFGSNWQLLRYVVSNQFQILNENSPIIYANTSTLKDIFKESWTLNMPNIGQYICINTFVVNLIKWFGEYIIYLYHI